MPLQIRTTAAFGIGEIEAAVDDGKIGLVQAVAKDGGANYRGKCHQSSLARC